jgi:hypothetical protein
MEFDEIKFGYNEEGAKLMGVFIAQLSLAGVRFKVFVMDGDDRWTVRIG